MGVAVPLRQTGRRTLCTENPLMTRSVRGAPGGVSPRAVALLAPRAAARDLRPRPVGRSPCSEPVLLLHGGPQRHHLLLLLCLLSLRLPSPPGGQGVPSVCSLQDGLGGWGLSTRCAQGQPSASDTPHPRPADPERPQGEPRGPAEERLGEEAGLVSHQRPAGGAAGAGPWPLGGAHLFSTSCTVSGSGWPSVSGRRATAALAATGTAP